MFLKKKKIHASIQISVVLILNILFLTVLHYLEDYLEIDLLKFKGAKNIMDNIAFYSIFLVLVAPILEELLYRLPLRKSKFTFVSLFVGIIYILIFKFLAIKIMLIVYLVGLGYLIISKKQPLLIFIILSILMFTVSHVGNYNVEDIKLLSITGYVFQFMPQLALGIITSFIRLKLSFSYALAYHISYNAAILTMAIIFE